MKIVVYILLILGVLNYKKEVQKKDNEQLNSKISLNKKSTQNLTKQNIDSINYEIVRKLFGDLIIKNEKSKNSLTLLKKNNFKIQKNKDNIGLSFEKCKPFTDQKIFDDKFNLKDSYEWPEEALMHKHFFYVKGDYVIVFDLLNFDLIKNSRECVKNKGFMIDYIRIFKKDIYIEKAKNSFSSFYSKKIEN